MTRLVEVSDVNSSCASDQEQQLVPESQAVVENSPAVTVKPAEPERSLQVLSLVKRGGLLAIPQKKEQ